MTRFHIEHSLKKKKWIKGWLNTQGSFPWGLWFPFQLLHLCSHGLYLIFYVLLRLPSTIWFKARQTDLLGLTSWWWNVFKLNRVIISFTDENGWKDSVQEPKLQIRQGSGIGQGRALRSGVHVFSASGQSQKTLSREEGTPWPPVKINWYALVLRTATVTGIMCLSCGVDWQTPREPVSSRVPWSSTAAAHLDSSFGEKQRLDVWAFCSLTQ